MLALALHLVRRHIPSRVDGVCEFVRVTRAGARSVGAIVCLTPTRPLFLRLRKRRNSTPLSRPPKLSMRELEIGLSGTI